MSVFKRIVAWFVSVITVIVLGVFLQTQNVIARLGKLGAEIEMGERISMSLYDIQHLGSLYGLFITIALAFAFFVGGFIYRFIKFGRPMVYFMAGFIAMIVLLFSMKIAFFDVHIIAGARDTLGIFMQMLAGGVGGFVFAKLTSPKPPKIS